MFEDIDITLASRNAENLAGLYADYSSKCFKF